MNVILTYLELLPQHVKPLISALSSPPARRELGRQVKGALVELKARKKAWDAKCEQEWKEMNTTLFKGMDGFPNSGRDSR